MKIQNLKSVLPPLCIFLFTFLIYIHNLSASVYGGDSGDFLSAIAVKGVPHPSGYPLYTLLGILASFLPIHQTLAWKVDLVSALLSSLSVVLMYGIVFELLKSRLLASITSLTLAFLFPFWLFAEVSEVFSLHHFLLLLVFYLALLFSKRKRFRYLYAVSFFTGLSFSNHELTVLILPSLLIFLIGARVKNTFSLKTISTCFGLFLLGLIPYLYIPIAASHHPPINWDNASNIGNFLQLITRSDYGWGVTGGTNWAIRSLSLQQYLSYMISALSLFTIILALLGIFALFRYKQFVVLLAILLAYLASGPVFFLYNAYITPDNSHFGIYEKFYTASLLFLLLLLPFGILYSTELILRFLSSTMQNFEPQPKHENVIFTLFLLIPLILFFLNFPKTDLHTIWLGDVFGRDILSPLPKGSIVTAPDEDIMFNSRYIQYAFSTRKDISMLTAKEALGIIQPEQFLTEGENQVTTISTVKYKQQQVKPATNLPVFITVDDYNKLSELGRTSLVPYGLLFGVGNLQRNPPSEDEFLHMQQPILAGFDREKDKILATDALTQLKLIADIPLWYARAYANTGYYLIDKYQDYQTAKTFFQKSLAVDPNSEAAYEGLGDYYYRSHDCVKAKDNYVQATQIDITNKRAYEKLYKVVDSCLHDTVTAEKLRGFFQRYSNIFQGVIK